MSWKEGTAGMGKGSGERETNENKVYDTMSEDIVVKPITLYVNLRRNFKRWQEKDQLVRERQEFGMIQLQGNSQDTGWYIQLGITALEEIGKEMVRNTGGADGPT